MCRFEEFSLCVVTPLSTYVAAKNCCCASNKNALDTNEVRFVEKYLNNVYFETHVIMKPFLLPSKKWKKWVFNFTTSGNLIIVCPSKKGILNEKHETVNLDILE